MNTKSIGRNDPCPCGSGKKYKQCCQNKEILSDSQNLRLQEEIPALFSQAAKHIDNNEDSLAEALYRKILAINPKHVSTLLNLAMILSKNKSEIDYAISLAEKAIKLEPSADAYNNLGLLFSNKKENNKAIRCFRESIRLNPGNTIALNNLSTLLLLENDYHAALDYSLSSLKINPKNYEALHNIASALLTLGRYSEAYPYFLQSSYIKPDFSIFCNLMFCLCFEADAFPTKYLEQAKRLEDYLQKQSSSYTQKAIATLADKKTLHIGFVSGDLRNHPVGYFIEGMLKHLNPNKLQLFAYSTNAQTDELSERIKPFFNKWLDLPIDFAEAAAIITQDSIDILIDLAGYTHKSGTAIFAWHPAPIQISWLGYFASTGLNCFDYFLADPISVPTQEQNHFSEKVYYLPHTRLCFTAPEYNIAISELPAIKNKFITFGCFQHTRKITIETQKAWGQILLACPNSRLLIKNNQIDDISLQDTLLEYFYNLGIAVNRIVFEAGGSREQYLAAYNRVDFILDTFPFPGGTTTCEALWMGVPTLTLSGNTLLQRQGHSMMANANLQEWICFSTEEYINKAIAFSNNIDYLSQLRKNLRQQALNSPLMNTSLFAQHFEQAMFDIWHHHT